MIFYSLLIVSCVLMYLQEVGNRMTEQNLALILGPNILHKDIKVRGDDGRGEGRREGSVE